VVNLHHVNKQDVTAEYFMIFKLVSNQGDYNGNKPGKFQA